jgi:type III secretory pathway component EscV
MSVQTSPIACIGVVPFAFIATAGGLLILVGMIGGLVLGLRLGERRNETPLKTDAILTIIPLLDVVAPSLVLIATSGVRGTFLRTHNLM